MKDFGAASQANLTRVNFQLWHRLPITVTHTINLVWLGTPWVIVELFLNLTAFCLHVCWGYALNSAPWPMATYFDLKTTTFHKSTTSFPTKWCLSKNCKNYTLMMCHYPDLDIASDWLCRKRNFLQPIGREFLQSLHRRHFMRKPVVAVFSG